MREEIGVMIRVGRKNIKEGRVGKSELKLKDCHLGGRGWEEAGNGESGRYL